MGYIDCGDTQGRRIPSRLEWRVPRLESREWQEVSPGYHPTTQFLPSLSKSLSPKDPTTVQEEMLSSRPAFQMLDPAGNISHSICNRCSKKYTLFCVRCSFRQACSLLCPLLPSACWSHSLGWLCLCLGGCCCSAKPWVAGLQNPKILQWHTPVLSFSAALERPNSMTGSLVFSLQVWIPADVQGKAGLSALPWSHSASSGVVLDLSVPQFPPLSGMLLGASENMIFGKHSEESQCLVSTPQCLLNGVNGFPERT